MSSLAHANHDYAIRLVNGPVHLVKLLKISELSQRFVTGNCADVESDSLIMT